MRNPLGEALALALRRCAMDLKFSQESVENNLEKFEELKKRYAGFIMEAQPERHTEIKSKRDMEE